MVLSLCILGTGVFFLIKHLMKEKSYPDYSLEWRFGDNATEKFVENNEKSLELLKNYRQHLPYQGKYKPDMPAGDCKIDHLYANDYPAYYAGYYFNVDGQLVVMIKASYFKEKYRNCDWYEELAKMFESEDFACCPRKYSYPELINAMSDVSQNGSVAQLLENAGIEYWGYGIGDYENHIKMSFRTEEDAEKARTVIKSDIYYIEVSGEPYF